MSCNHEWVESIRCTACGQTIEHRAEGFAKLREEVNHLEACNEQLRIGHTEDRQELQRRKLEIARLRDTMLDALALLRDWEDYDPDDPECSWVARRDDFLEAHEGEP